MNITLRTIGTDEYGPMQVDFGATHYHDAAQRLLAASDLLSNAQVCRNTLGGLLVGWDSLSDLQRREMVERAMLRIS